MKKIELEIITDEELLDLVRLFKGFINRVNNTSFPYVDSTDKISLIEADRVINEYHSRK